MIYFRLWEFPWELQFWSCSLLMRILGDFLWFLMFLCLPKGTFGWMASYLIIPGLWDKQVLYLTFASSGSWALCWIYLLSSHVYVPIFLVLLEDQTPCVVCFHYHTKTSHASGFSSMENKSSVHLPSTPCEDPHQFCCDCMHPKEWGTELISFSCSSQEASYELTLNKHVSHWRHLEDKTATSSICMSVLKRCSKCVAALGDIHGDTHSVCKAVGQAGSSPLLTVLPKDWWMIFHEPHSFCHADVSVPLQSLLLFFCLKSGLLKQRGPCCPIFV